MNYTNLQAIKLCFLRYCLAGMDEAAAFDKVAAVVGTATMSRAWCELQPVPVNNAPQRLRPRVTRSFIPRGQVLGFQPATLLKLGQQVKARGETYRTTRAYSTPVPRKPVDVDQLQAPGAMLAYILGTDHTPRAGQ